MIEEDEDVAGSRVEDGFIIEDWGSFDEEFEDGLIEEEDVGVLGDDVEVDVDEGELSKRTSFSKSTSSRVLEFPEVGL